MTRLAVPKKYRDTIEECIANYGPCQSDLHAFRVLTHLQWEHGLELPDLINRLHPEHRPTIMLHEGNLERGVPTVWLLGWSQHETTGMHGHGDSAAAIAVLQGNIINDSLVEGMKEPLRQYIRKGSLFTFPKGALHDVKGMSDDPGQRDVTVHAYWPPLTHMDWYEPKTLKLVESWDEGTQEQRQDSLES